MSTVDYNQEFLNLGIQVPKETYTNANDFAQRFQKASLLKESNIAYSNSTNTLGKPTNKKTPRANTF